MKSKPVLPAAFYLRIKIRKPFVSLIKLVMDTQRGTMRAVCG